LVAVGGEAADHKVVNAPEIEDSCSDAKRDESATGTPADGHARAPR
jgi:hypothetical protein